jgi:hypothetical protein
MFTTTVAIGVRHAAKRLTLSVLLLTLAVPGLTAQDASASRSTRVTALSGGLAHGSALVVDPVGSSDTRLSPGATFGLEIQHPTFSFGSLYAGVAGSFSTLEHGANLGVAAGPGSSGATIILATAGLVIEASDWFDNLRPTLRLGGGLKAYSFTTTGASSYAAFTGDIGAGFRGGAGAIEISGEVRYLPSAFDQGKLPLRGLSPQDQRQTDLLFTVGVTVKP